MNKQLRKRYYNETILMLLTNAAADQTQWPYAKRDKPYYWRDWQLSFSFGSGE